MITSLNIDEIRELGACQLAPMADVSSPDAPDSPGAELLQRARDWYLEHRAEIQESRYPEDVISEVAGINANNGGAVDYRTYQMMMAFTDLQLWQWEAFDDGILGEIRWENITDVIAVVEGEVALRLVHELYAADDVADLNGALDDGDDDGEEG